MCSRSSTPSSTARRTSSRVTAGGSATAVLQHERPRRARRRRAARRCAPRRRARPGHRAPPAARAAPRALRAPPRSSRGRGSRPGRRTAARAPRRSESTPARAALPPRSRTAAARRPSPCAVEPDATRRESAEHDVARTASARWYAIDAPIAPAPATTIRATRRAPSARRRSGRAAARARPRAIGTPRARDDASAPRGTGKRSSAARSSPTPRVSAVGLADERRRPPPGNADASAGHGAGGAALRALRDRAPRADEDVEALEEVRLERLPRAVRDLQAGEVRRALAQPLDHRRAGSRSRSRAANS